MIKKEITYEDFDGAKVTENHYFHLSKSELIDMELKEKDGMAVKLQRIVDSNNGAAIMAEFKDILGKAYGLRDSENSGRFIKSPEISANFMGSLAFDALLGEILTDPVAAAHFVNNLLPKDLASDEGLMQALKDAGVGDDKIKAPGMAIGTPSTYYEENEVSGLANPRDAKNKLLPWAFRPPTDQELMSMTKAQMADVFKRKNAGWQPRML